MQLWTHHASGFRLDSLPLPLDPRRGEFWNRPHGPNFCYRTVVPILWERLGTDQFLWCCTLQGKFPRKSSDDDLVEWELNVPEASVLAFINALAWESMVSGGAEKWDTLFIRNRPIEVSIGVHALVSVPLPPGSVTCRGPVTAIPEIQVIHNGDVEIGDFP